MSEERGSGWTAHAREGVIYVRLYGLMTKDLVDAMQRLHFAATAQRPGGIGILLDLGDSVTMPPGDVRRYSTDMLKRHQDGILVHATVYASQSLVAGAIRSALNGIFVLARSAYPRTVVASPEEAIRFVRTRLGVGAPDEASMTEVFESLRAK